MDESKHTSHRWPWFCRDGRHFLFLAIAHGAAETQDNALYFASLDGGEPQQVMRTSASAVVASDRLLFLREGSLLAAPIDTQNGRMTGDPAVIGTDVTYDVTIWRGAFSSSQNGILAYHSGQSIGAQSLFRLDRTGKELGRVGEPAVFDSARLSPDGKRLAAPVLGVSSDVWVFDLARGTKSRLSFENGGSNVEPCWSPDGRSILYANIFLSSKERLHRLIRRPSGGGDAEVLLESHDEKWPSDWSKDGKYLLFTQGRYIGGKPADIWVLSMIGKREPFEFLKTQFEEEHAKFSPDGRWVAYDSNESGRKEVYVAPFSATGGSRPGGQADGGGNPPTSSAPASEARRTGKWQVSTGGGESPAWRGDGKELFYFAADRKITAVEVNGEGDNFEIGGATALFAANVPGGLDPLDVSADGQWFVVNTSTATGSTPISLVVNWPAELKAK